MGFLLAVADFSLLIPVESIMIVGDSQVNLYGNVFRNGSLKVTKGGLEIQTGTEILTYK